MGTFTKAEQLDNTVVLTPDSQLANQDIYTVPNGKYSLIEIKHLRTAGYGFEVVYINGNTQSVTINEGEVLLSNNKFTLNAGDKLRYVGAVSVNIVDPYSIFIKEFLEI